MTDKELQELIRLKRFEQPEEGYFDDFLTEFQQRQRSEILNTSARGLFVERVKAWFGEIANFGQSGSGRYALVGGLACAACAAIAVTVHFLPKQSSDSGSAVAQAPVTDVSAPSGVAIIDHMKSSVNQPSSIHTVAVDQMRSVDFSQPQAPVNPMFSAEETIF